MTSPSRQAPGAAGGTGGECVAPAEPGRHGRATWLPLAARRRGGTAGGAAARLAPAAGRWWRRHQPRRHPGRVLGPDRRPVVPFPYTPTVHARSHGGEAGGRHGGRLDVARRQDQADVRHAVRRPPSRPSSTTSSAAWTPTQIRGWRYRDASRGMNLGEDMAGATPNASFVTAQNVGFSTVFPVSMARGAAFDLDLEYAIGEAIGDEMQAAKETLLLAPVHEPASPSVLGPRAGDLRRGPVPHGPPRDRDDHRRAAARRRQRQALHGLQHRGQPRDRTTRSSTSRRCARSTAVTSGWSFRTAASRP